MEAKMSSMNNGGCCCGGGDKEELRLPGFRFHPTDEELVGFYLKRKVEKRSLRGVDIIIKHVDIYKHDPWDLACADQDSSNEGSNSKSEGDNNKELYFYCKRGRKYKNSIRPNRVTCSGFWKATGIDKPIYSNNNNNNNNNNNVNIIGDKCKIIGLKKSLVYYRGSAGKGTKTDWMMHEFRLPNHPYLSNSNNNNYNDIAHEEAEIWTLCRIFKRNKRQNPYWRELSTKKTAMKESSRTSSIDSNTNNYQHYITFVSTNNDNTNMINTIISDDNTVPNAQNMNVIMGNEKNTHNQRDQNQQQWDFVAHTPPSYSSSLNLVAENENDHLQPLAYYYGQNNWDDLNSVVEFAVKTPVIM